MTPGILTLAYLAWTGLIIWLAATQRTRALGLTVLAAFVLVVLFVALGLKAADQDSDGTTLFGLMFFVAVVGPWLVGSVALAYAVWAATAFLAWQRERRRNEAEGIL